MYVCVCFPNWTGTVAEVKRGQLKKGRWPGGSTEIELAGGLGLWESIRETEFFTSKTAYSLDKRKPCSHATAAHTHTPHSVALLPLMRWISIPSRTPLSASLLYPSLPACWTSVESCVQREILTKRLERWNGSFNYMLLLWCMVFLSGCLRTHTSRHTHRGTSVLISWIGIPGTSPCIEHTYSISKTH